MSMKTVLCYGDSLTWGTNPEGGRHAFEDRWPSALGAGLGEDKVRIIAEGLGGRTTVFDDHSGPRILNGATILPTILASHNPLDCVVIMLGCNDLKPFINGSALAAAMGVKRLVEIIRTFPYGPDQPVPEVVIVTPPEVVATDNFIMAPMFDNGIAESKKFVGFYKFVADEVECGFFDAATVATASALDGIHLNAASTRAIGVGLVPVVQKALGL